MKHKIILNRLRNLFLLLLFFTPWFTANVLAWNEGGEEQDLSLKSIANLSNGIKAYEVCSACHMPEGWGTPDGTYPQISGQHQNVLIKQLTDIRQLNRDNPSMYPFALPEEMGGAQAVADVTAYIATLPMLHENGLGSGNDLILGKQLYDKNCTQCHGNNGQGDNVKFYPRIHGQHYKYLLRQFKWMQLGKRRNANPDMLKQIKSFSQRDARAVLDYVSRLRPPQERSVHKTWRNSDFD
ncbi:MAG: c-type cytochrome [Pseudomonadota bacterium]